MKNKVFNPLRKFYRHYFIAPQYSSSMEVEQAEHTFYINYLRPGMTVFDVGANIGEMSLLFSRFVSSSGQVHSFEASSSMFKKLSTVCQITNREQIVLNHKAVADRETILKFHVYDDFHSGWSSLAQRPLEKYGINVKPTHVEEVEAITIDGYCQQHNIEQIDLIKIDVEGAEYQVLLGARKMLESRKIRCCTFEFGGTTFDMGNAPQEIEDYLKQLGYQLRNVVKGDPVFPGGAKDITASFSMHIAQPK